MPIIHPRVVLMLGVSFLRLSQRITSFCLTFEGFVREEVELFWPIWKLATFSSKIFYGCANCCLFTICLDKDPSIVLGSKKRGTLCRKLVPRFPTEHELFV